MASGSVPWPVAGASVERGKNSYHALKRARTGSTSTSSGLASSAIGSRTPVRQNSASRSSPTVSGSTSSRSGMWPSRWCGTSSDGSSPSGRVSPASSRRRRSRERRGVVALRPGEGLVDQADADLQVDGDVDAGGQLELHAVAPRAEVVEPADDLVLPAAELVGDERRLEAVVAERRHRDLLPRAAAPAAGSAARPRRGRGRR